MRLFSTINEALSEIKRDLWKGPKVESTRVQQFTDIHLNGRELLGYSYAIEAEGFPSSVQGLVEIGKKFGFRAFQDESVMVNWLFREEEVRRFGRLANNVDELNDKAHPFLIKTLEGNWTAYTYGERLYGAFGVLAHALQTAPDTRRAYWPIFTQADALRSSAPTRVPCSLGYQVLTRQTTNGPRLILYYLQRSADFDAFFLTDLWLAHRFQLSLADHLQISPGQMMHTIISLHSFTAEHEEVY